MLRFIKLFSIIAVLFLSHAAMAGKNTLTAGSVWINQSGSTITFTSVDPTNGQLSGFYINNAKGYSCQGTPYQVTGYTYGTLISWSVLWKNLHQNCQSITAWTGYLDSASGMIITDWKLVFNNKISDGKDKFSRVPQLKTKGLISAR